MKNREWLLNTATIDKLMIIAKRCYCPIKVLTGTNKDNAILSHKRCKSRKATGSCLSCLNIWLNEEKNESKN